MEGILIGTAILWIVSAVFVLPITNICVSRKMVAEGVEALSIDSLTNEQKKYWKGIATSYYILIDIVILGIVGFIGGLLGFYFIGISLELKGWPGMLAFIFSSYLGLLVRNF